MVFILYRPPVDSRAEMMEKLVYLAESLAKASHRTYAYKEEKTLNSAFSKVCLLLLLLP